MGADWCRCQSTVRTHSALVQVPWFKPEVSGAPSTWLPQSGTTLQNVEACSSRGPLFLNHPKPALKLVLRKLLRGETSEAVQEMPREAVGSPSLEGGKTRLVGHGVGRI